MTPVGCRSARVQEQHDPPQAPPVWHDPREAWPASARVTVTAMVGRTGIIIALLSSAALVGLGVMSFHEGTAKSRPVVMPFDVFWCEKDTDCVAVDRIGCCACQQGGGQAAITSWHTDNLRRFLKQACKPEQVCVQVDVCLADLRPRCVDRHCQLAVNDD